MNYNETKDALDKFAKYVIQQARSNLTKKKKNLSKNLYNSLKYDLDEKDDGLYLTIYMDEYGEFIDKGVKGANPSLVKNGKQKAPNSPYRYKFKKPPHGFIMNWAKQRNFRLRDSKGRFSKGNYRAIGFVLQKFIFAQGIKPSYFFTKPFKQAFKRLPEGLGEAFAKDIINITIETE